MIDIQSSVARLLAKPMLPKAAKQARMTKANEDPAGVQLSRQIWKLSQDRKTPAIVVVGSTEMIAGDWLIERVGFTRRRGNARAARRRCNALRLNERAQDGHRQVRVSGLDGSIEPIGQFSFARQRAVPFALVIGDAANLP